MQPIRQGDVILLPVQGTQKQTLSHLTLAEGEVTQHSYQKQWSRRLPLPGGQLIANSY